MVAFRLPEELLGEARKVAKGAETTVTKLVTEGLIRELIVRKFNESGGLNEEAKKYADRIGSIGMDIALKNIVLSTSKNDSSLVLKNNNYYPKRVIEEKTALSVYTTVYTPPSRQRKGDFVLKYKNAVKNGFSQDQYTPEILYGQYLSIRREINGSYGPSRIDHDLESIQWLLNECSSWFSDDLEISPTSPPSIVSGIFNNLRKIRDTSCFSLESLRKRHVVQSWGLDKGIIKASQDEEWGI
jgi:hypothetical protein